MPTTLERHLQDPEFARLFAEEGFINEVQERICEWMEREGITRAELARRLGSSRANVTQLLSGRNVSLRVIARALHVMGARPVFAVESAIPSEHGACAST